MVAAHFFLRGGKSFSIAHFNHGTPQANEFEAFVSNWASKHSIPFCRSTITHDKPKDQSPEEYWRNQRYAWFATLPLVATCHHLSDVVETWIMSSMHGSPKIIMPHRNNIIRPFLTTSKQDILAWAQDNDVKWVEDKSNTDTSFPRNNIRHRLMPLALEINPGLLKTMKKKVLAMKDATE
jgi:tRNA(Ile)-lysidine synthase